MEQATFRRRTLLGAVPAAAAAAAAPSLPWAAAAAADVEGGRWATGWGRSLVPATELEQLVAGEIYRETAEPGLAGSAVRLVLSNAHADQPLRIDRAAVRSGGRELTAEFGGLPGIRVPPGARVTTDPIALPVVPDSKVELDLELGAPFAPGTVERRARKDGAAILAPGGGTRREIAPAIVSALEVRMDAKPPVLVVLSDTKSAGPETWPPMLARMAAGRLGVVNRSVYAGHLALGPAGASALARLESEVLATTGATHVLVFTGNNDLIQPGMINSRGQPTLDPAQGMSAAELTALLGQCVGRLRGAGLKVLGGTWLPYEGVTIAQGYSTPEKLAKRDAVNTWIRGPGAFDEVIDFDAALRDPAQPQRLAAAFDEGNHFTPNVAGYRRMAEMVAAALLPPSAKEVIRPGR